MIKTLFMNDEWRFTAKSVTKYNPIYRDEEGYYTKEEWIGFFQLGKNINGELLTFDLYLETESKYITAAKWFFQFHGCSHIIIKNVEKNDFSDYQQSDKEHLLEVYNLIKEGFSLSIDDLDNVIKLILRELAWAELICSQDESIAVRFGYDFYMYFNSNRDLNTLIERINKLGLYVW